MEREKYVDKGWKESVEQEKKAQQSEEKKAPENDMNTERSSNTGDIQQEQQESIEVNFLTYVTSLTFQAIIFLGEVPNPMNADKIEVNLKQAKFLIDTLIMIRDKTKGNLEKQEEELLNTSIYELQLKYVERSKNESKVKD